MTYLAALLEAESALQRRRGWYTCSRARWGRSQRRRAELDAALARIHELIAAARAMEAAT